MHAVHRGSAECASGAADARRNAAPADRQGCCMDTTRRAALAGIFAALASPRAALAQDGVITGTAAYRERIALPPGAVLEVELRDTARADASAEALASARVETTGQVPIPFTLRFDPARLDPLGTYAVAARLSFGGRVQFRSDRLHPVPTRGAGAGAQVEILLVRATAPPEDAASAPPLVGPAWILEHIAGRGVASGLRSDITFGADGRAFGSGGCNRFTGGYTLAGASLRFGAMAQTNMACEPPAMDQEARFHAALAAVRGWRIERGLLHLVGDGGATLLRLARAG
jgi:putative lipoprotein